MSDKIALQIFPPVDIIQGIDNHHSRCPKYERMSRWGNNRHHQSHIQPLAYSFAQCYSDCDLHLWSLINKVITGPGEKPFRFILFVNPG